LTSEKEQFYIQRIAELEKQVAELPKVNAELADKVAASVKSCFKPQHKIVETL